MESAFAMALVAIAALVALLLGTVGIYGVISYAVSQRTREIGVRMALGAAGGDVRGMVVRQGMALAGAGLLLGVAGAVAMTRVLTTILFEVDALDTPTFLSAVAVLGGVTLLASYLPARRATRVDPIIALRQD